MGNIRDIDEFAKGSDMKKAALFVVLILTMTASVSCKRDDGTPANHISIEQQALAAEESPPDAAPSIPPTATDEAPATEQPTSEAPVTEPATEAPAETAAVSEPPAEPEPTPEPAPEPKTFEQLAPTVTMPFGELVGDNGIYDEIQRYPAPDTYKVVVDIYHQVVMAYTRDENGEYTIPERYMVCTTGGPKDPTPGGEFNAGTHRPRFGKFYKDNVYGQYWTQIVGKIYFHSLLYTQRSAATYTTSSYKLLGKRGSHGCIRLLVPDARWIYYHISPGSVVEIRAGSKDDAETAAIKQQLVRAELPGSRPQVNGLPNTDVWSIEELNAGLQAADRYALSDGRIIDARGDMYSSVGVLMKLAK